ncbi:MAG TPA: hypothetical protein VIG51_02670 [Candidatus Baltobacteraceae bacterium]|jgi:hypothetical protein
MKRVLPVFLVLLLAACGGGGGGNAGTSLVPQNPSPNGPTSTSTQRATASIVFRVPNGSPTTGASVDRHAASKSRHPYSISPGTNNLTFSVDSTAIVNDAVITNNYGSTQTFTGKDGSTVTLSGTLSGDYFVFTLAFQVTPGHHTLGVALLANAPNWVLSEGSGSFTLAPGNNGNIGTLALNGVVANGYIECATAAENTDGNNCNNYGNFDPNSGAYTFTAVAADYDGFPIVQQAISGSYLPFDNGAYTVSESPADSPAILTLTGNGPFNEPGGDLTGPSGSWYVPGSFTYGHHFTVQCSGVGEGHVVMQLNGSGGTPLVAIPGINYTNSGKDSTSQYPAANELLPTGSKTSNSHGNANAVTNVLNVECSATGQLTLI